MKLSLPRIIVALVVAHAVVVVAQSSGPSTAQATAPKPPQADRELAQRFASTVQPFLDTYCFQCHEGDDPEGELDLSKYASVDAVIRDGDRWGLVLDKLWREDMPPKKAKKHPAIEARTEIVDWIRAVRRNEAVKHAGDPGLVLAHRLSNSEYNYTIRDLTGVDIKPAREFPVDPTNPAGFDNTGESLAMSPALMTKYLDAARAVASHLVLSPDRLDFAPHPMLVETDRDKFCVRRIIDLYHRQDTDFSHYFYAAWRFKHRAALGTPTATLAQIAAERGVSAKYLATIWRTLEETPEDIGPLAKLQAHWRELPKPEPPKPESTTSASKASSDRTEDARVRAACDRMRDDVIAVRQKIAFMPQEIAIKGISRTSQPFLMYRNREYATHRRSFDPAMLQVEGEARPAATAAAATADAGNDAADEEGGKRATRPAAIAGDPDLVVPAGQRARYEAAFTRFASVFPDTFYISERGRYFPDNTRDKGRHLSAGFHNLMGYFRDDQPLYELILDAKQQKELDALWQDLDFVALASTRTYVQFYLNESGDAGVKVATAAATAGSTLDESRAITAPAMVDKIAAAYLAKARASGNAIAVKAIEDHFARVHADLRWVEQTRATAEPKHVQALVDLAARAYRRPLAQPERAEIVAYYQALRKDGLSHDDAVRDSVVAILMAPDFCYRLDAADPGPGVRPLSTYALASRLSYFLWSSMPDQELLSHAASGDLRKPDVLVAQARRMLKDPRVRGLVTEFGGNWLDFRRFEEINSVDRERFSSFTNDLRQAMFEEPVRFLLDVARENRSVLDLLYAKHTFVNPVLAKHYGMPESLTVSAANANASFDGWTRVDDATPYGRGGVLPMAAFLTKNAPGLRTSPVKRGYWVVKQVLGERIPPPPAVVPELPRDEAKAELPLRDMLARHREDATCAACHARFDSFGLAFEGYGPVGERRTQDLAGRPVDDSAPFPGGVVVNGVEGLRTYVRDHRQDDYLDNLSRKLLAYALGRSLMLSDDLTVEQMRARLAKSAYRFDTLIETIVTSPQFLNKRSPDLVSSR